MVASPSRILVVCFLSLFVSTTLLPHHLGSHSLRPKSDVAATLPNSKHRRLSVLGPSDPKTVQLRPVVNEGDEHDAPIPVFYNVFTKSARDIPRVISIVREQFSQLLPRHEVLISSIGTPIASEITKIKTNSRFTTELMQHNAEGFEFLTLSRLWQHCKDNPTDKVVYLHSKGSFHPSKKNDNLRQFITRGTLSEECANAPPSCNVCSTRMSPMPHPHTSGNIWLARCDYVQKLSDPLSFESQMNRVPFKKPLCAKTFCCGKGWFAAEHWIHSHPSVMPCDLYKSQSFTAGYEPLPKGNQWEMDLRPAPRFDHAAYHKPRSLCDGNGFEMEDRLMEYETLYGEKPSYGWWGWKFFGDYKGNGPR